MRDTDQISDRSDGEDAQKVKGEAQWGPLPLPTGYQLKTKMWGTLYWITIFTDLCFIIYICWMILSYNKLESESLYIIPDQNNLSFC